MKLLYKTIIILFSSFVLNYAQINISGNTGTPNTTLNWFDVTNQSTSSDGLGDYTISVSSGWTGDITPTKTGYTFSPVKYSYSNVLTDQLNQDYTAIINTYTISGNTGTGSVLLSGGPSPVTSDGSGDYSISVPYNWSGTITPSKDGYTFSPVNQVYSNVTTNQTQNYSAIINTYTISGNTGVGSVLLSWTEGTPQTITSAANGTYTITVNHGFTGTITPSKAGYTFTPSSKSYASTPVTSNLVNQNFTESLNSYTISGNTGTESVLLSGGPSPVTSDGSGVYSITVPYNWSGTITPSKDGYTFSPANQAYSNVTTNQTQNYAAIINTYTISGNTGSGSVLLSWTDETAKTITSAANGSYTITVNYGFTGTITPSKVGYTFTPSSNSYASTPVTSNLVNQNFTESLNSYTISGNTGTGSVLLSWTEGTPQTFTSAANGSYTITVNHGFTGTITPSKTGYTFTPSSRSYASTPVTSNLANQNFTGLLNSYTISGNSGTGSVLLSGGPSPVTSDGSGDYSISVPYNWSGTITPSKDGYTFSPVNQIYSNVTTNQTQNYSAIINTYTISGNTGVGSVLLSWMEGTPQTFTSATNGNYSITVNHGFTGTITPSKAGYTFTPSSNSYASTPVTSNLVNQNFTESLNSYTISGNTGTGSVLLSGGPSPVTSDGSGVYSITVPYNWSGTITPSKDGYTFSPVNQVYSNVTTNQTQNYTAIINTYTISGNTGAGSVLLSWTDGTAKTFTSASNGNYSITVNHGFTGTITPSKTGYTFTPSSRSYASTPVTSNLVNQNFTESLNSYTISGNTGTGSVLLSWTEGTPQTITSAANGSYTITVNHGFTGTITPSKAGYTFTPSSRSYASTPVTSNLVNQNFTESLNSYTISGNTGTGSVLLSGGPSPVTSDGSGVYSITVPYDWSGTITPSKDGYTFSPVNQVYSNVTTNQTQNYSAIINTYTISGNTGVGSVLLSWTEGTPQTITSAANGTYTITVNHGFTGTITPSKAGYTFTPSSKSYASTPVTSNLVNQNFTESLNSYTISGNTGTGSVLLSWTDGTVKTFTSATNGSYSITVNHGFTGTITPSKAGYTFTPSSRSFASTPVTSNLVNQNFTESLNSYTISGNTGTGSVLLSGGPSPVTSDGSGVYSITVPYNWSGTITPSKDGYTFSPVNQLYSNVTTNQTQNYAAIINTYTISGNTGAGSVLLSWTEGTPQTITSAANGSYTITVNHGFTGTITPSKVGYTFTPSSRSYASTPVISNLVNQNFTESLNSYTISGNTGTGSVLLSWTEGTPQTFTSAANGSYTITVNHGFTGTITPSKAGYTFTPSSRSFASTPVISNLVNQNFTGLLNSYTISGNTGTGSVLLSWTEGTAKTLTSAANGEYSITVNHGFTGIITPSKVGYTFTPIFKSYNDLSASITNDSYVAVLNTYNLTTDVIPLNSGTVTGGGVYNYGTTAELEAIPEIGYSFVSWSGDLTSTENPENVFIDDNKNITANFQLNSYIISTATFPTIGGTATGGGTFNHGTSVTLVARSTTGYKFVDWKLNGLPVSEDSNYTFTAVTAGIFTANFILKKYNVVANPIPPEGGIITGPGIYEHGAMVNLVAQSNTGWKFNNWMEGTQITTVDSNYYFVAFATRDLKANFSKKIYNLSTSSFPAEAGTTNGNGNYEHGTNVTIIANPNVGWKFSNWKENDTLKYTDSLTTFPILKSRILVANYARKVYSINATSSPSIGGTIQGDSTYTHGDLVRLTAIANNDSGYEFINWTENGAIVKTDPVFTFTATKTRSLIANFRLKTYSVNLQSNPSDAGKLSGNDNYTHGDLVTIVANPEPGWLFANWTEGTQILSDVTTFSFRVIKNINITANFAKELYSISGSPLPIEAGFVSGTGSAFYGQNVTLTAAPNLGWDFKHWKEGDIVVSTNPAYLFAVNGNRTLIAEFTLTNYSITCSADPSQGGTTNGCGLSHYGQNMSINAIANSGYKFINWTENDIIVSTIPNYSFPVQRNRELVAHFDFSTDLEKIDNSDIIPDHYYLSNAFPNPFNPETNIQFGLPEPSEISLTIFDVRGQTVENLLDKVSLQSGNYNKKFTPVNITSGIYFYRIFANAIGSENKFIKVGKLVLVK